MSVAFAWVSLFPALGVEVDYEPNDALGSMVDNTCGAYRSWSLGNVDSMGQLAIWL